ncbi:molybdenum cofactor guanylyltransferase MobA [bacterium]|nr:molybdenum cofactor guanylyltransferase MobA [bacterium]MBU1882932.1 molybdenum cofactor guanylyltransferase MobA [bacterium]
MTDIPCVILAGGKSSRMGADKSLLPFGSCSTLTEFQYERLKKIFKNLYISCKSSKTFSSLKENEEVNFIEDACTDELYAPTVGFISIFEALHVEQVFVLSVDTPFVEEKEIEEILKHKDEGYDAVIAKTPEGMHPLCGLYSRSLHAEFKKMLENNEHRLGRLLEDSNTLYVNFEDEKPFLNLNHPHEYKAALLQSNR